MKAPSHFHSLLHKFLLVILLITLTGCASAPDDEPVSISPPEDEQNTEYHTPRLMGFVIDPDGEPVAYAEVGGEAIATEDGVARGDFLDYQDGWFPVTALGYASGFAKPFAEDQGFPFFVTRLTHYQSMRKIDSEASVTLRGSYKEEIYLSAEISLELFQDPSPVVGLAVIDRYSVSPLLAPYPDGEGLRLRSAFALEAFDEDWNPTKLNSGATIPVTLELLSPLSDQVAFARFDMDSGEWQTVDLGCEKGEGNLYTCQLDTLDPLIGIFDQPETFTAGVTHSPREGAAALSSGTTPEEDYQDALQALQDWIISQQDNPSGINQDNPDLIKLIYALKKAAMDFAKNNQNEKGKQKLIEAAGQAQETGQLDTGNELNGEAGKLSNKLGEKALKESYCGEYKKMLNAAGQIQFLGGDEALAQQIIDKVKEMVKDCDVWTGTVTVAMVVPRTHPSDLDLEGGGGIWWEFHTVKITTNVKTLAMYGEAKVRIAFDQVTFERSDPCPKVIQISGSGGDAMVVFKGIYDGYSFYIHELDPQGSPGSIRQTWQTEAKEDGKCELIREHNFSFPNYYSLIVHGVSSDSPPISYYEILGTGTADQDSMGLVSFRGEENIVNPDPQMGVLPFLEGRVYWRFLHAVQVLPLKNEK